MQEMIPVPEQGNYPAYYDNYFAKLDTHLSVPEQMQRDAEKYREFIQQIPEHKMNYRYAEGKWTTAQVLQHIVDTERIMAYRGLSLARQEKNALLPFEENDYAVTAAVSHKPVSYMALEWITVRQSSIALFLGLTSEEMVRKGHVGTNVVSVNAIARLIVGHARHHFDVLLQRYL